LLARNYPIGDSEHPADKSVERSFGKLRPMEFLPICGMALPQHPLGSSHSGGEIKLMFQPEHADLGQNFTA
jgi:hypothetical protein